MPVNSRIPAPNRFLGLSLRLLVWACVLFPVASDGAIIAKGVQATVQSGNPIWVFLKDKGPMHGRLELAAQGRITPRAANRIARRGGPYDPNQDLPVFGVYRDSLISSGLTIRAESRWLNAVAGVVSAERLSALTAFPFVDSLRPVTIYRRPIDTRHEGVPPLRLPTLPKPSGLDYGNSRDQIQAIEVDILHDRGLDGQGVRIGFLDAGYSLGIDAFRSLRFVATRDFINNDTDVGDGDTVQMDHGTGTLSVCGGYLPGQLIGVAYGAEFVLAKTEIIGEEIRIEEDYWVAGLEWIDSLGCDIVSSSLGYDDWYTQADFDGNTATATIAADLAARRGLLVVNAAGNRGAAGLVAPADGDSVLAVGMSDLLGVPDPRSSRGPTADGRIKPDVVAPGDGVWSALPRNGSFKWGEGTSFATPLVAGVCALLLQESPGLSPYQLIDLLHRTSAQAAHPANDVGWGMVRAAYAAGGLPELDSATEIEVWPNPTEGRVQIIMPGAPTEGVSRFDVFTAAGDPVYSGEIFGHVGVWLGLNQKGQPVASGIYLIWVKTSSHEGIAKVAVVRRD